jgi:hypothetical protein
MTPGGPQPGWMTWLRNQFPNSLHVLTLELSSIYRNVRFEVFTAGTMKNAVFWDVTPCGSCKNLVSADNIASIIRVERISWE